MEAPPLKPGKHDRASAADHTGGESGKKTARTPAWAKGLRQLYDSVVDEALPDSFEDLLKRLDEAGK